VTRTTSRRRLQVDRHPVAKMLEVRDAEARHHGDRLRARVIGQDARAPPSRPTANTAAAAPGLSDPSVPSASFIFLGPTGVRLKRDRPAPSPSSSSTTSPGQWSASTCPVHGKSTPSPGSSERLPATVGYDEGGQPHRGPSADAPTPSFSSTRSRRPTPMSSMSSSRSSTTGRLTDSRAAPSTFKIPSSS